MVALLMAFGLAGCAPSACQDGCGSATDDPTPEDTAAMVYSTEDPDPVWTADDVGARITELMSYGAPNPVDIADAFARIMSEGDELCPGDPFTLVNAPCSAADGSYYQGIGWLYVADRVRIADADIPATWYHGGDFEILRASGARFAGGGDLKYTTEFGDSQATTTFIVKGTWEDATREDWLGAAFSGVYTGVVSREVDAWSFTINGGIGVGDLDTQFVNVSWSSAEPCLGAPTGTIEVRDARGYWYAWDLGDDCDACGPVTFHQDQDLGELCLDLSEWGALMAQLSSPR